MTKTGILVAHEAGARVFENFGVNTVRCFLIFEMDSVVDAAIGAASVYHGRTLQRTSTHGWS